MNSKPLPKGITQIKSNSSKNTMITERLGYHYCNTTKSIITMLFEHSDIDVSLNRIGSNPLEHLFGKLRLKSHFQNNIITALKNIAREQTMNMFEEMREMCATKRIRSFGITVNANHQKEEQYQGLFCYTPLEVAVSLLYSLEIEHPFVQNYAKKLDFIKFNVYERLAYNISYCLDIKEIKRKILTSSLLTCGVVTGLRGRDLVQAKAKIEESIKSDTNMHIAMDESKRRYLEACLGHNPRVCDLKSVVAETSNLYQVKINKGSLRNKSDILRWIEEHWEIAKPILSSMLELKCSL